MKSRQSTQPVPTPQPAPVGTLLTLKQVAERLGVHRVTLHTYMQQGLRVTRLGTRTVRIDENDLYAWLNHCKAAS